MPPLQAGEEEDVHLAGEARLHTVERDAQGGCEATHVRGRHAGTRAHHSLFIHSHTPARVFAEPNLILDERNAFNLMNEMRST